MKKESYFRKLLLSAIILMALCLAGSATTTAQGITTYQYRYVAPDKQAEFIRRETTYWSKVAQRAIDKGSLTFWGLFQKIGGVDIPNSPNFLFVNTYPDIDGDMSGLWDPTKLFPGVAADKINTYGMSTELMNVFLHDEGWQQGAGVDPVKDFQYVVMNYHNSTNPTQFIATEKNQWGPFIQASMDNKLTDQKGWGSAIVLSPIGGKMMFNCVSFDLYSTLNAALMQPWKPDTKFPMEGLDSLQKISINSPMTFVYRVVKVVSKN
ncbi:MAG: hypothetical protein ABIO76_05600 [Ginsengibacter sp.]